MTNKGECTSLLSGPAYLQWRSSANNKMRPTSTATVAPCCWTFGPALPLCFRTEPPLPYTPWGSMYILTSAYWFWSKEFSPSETLWLLNSGWLKYHCEENEKRLQADICRELSIATYALTQYGHASSSLWNKHTSAGNNPKGTTIHHTLPFGTCCFTVCIMCTRRYLCVRTEVKVLGEEGTREYTFCIEIVAVAKCVDTWFRDSSST